MADNQNTNPTPQQTPRTDAPQPAPAPRPEPTAMVSEIKPVARENANTAESLRSVKTTVRKTRPTLTKRRLTIRFPSANSRIT